MRLFTQLRIKRTGHDTPTDMEEEAMKEQSKDQGFHMGLFEVRERPWGRQGARLEIFYDGEHIGEYERTHYSKRDPRLQDKIREVYSAASAFTACT